MKTIKLKIANDFDCLEERRVFNDAMRFSYNRFKDGLAEKSIYDQCRNLFKLNSWLVLCALKEGKSIFDKFNDKKIVFGGRNNLNQYLNKIITKEEYRKNRMSPITIQGEKLLHGNRMFDFDLVNSKLIFKSSKYVHKEIIFPKLRNNLKREFAELQRLIDEKQITVTIKLTNEYVWIIYDESLLNCKKYKDLKYNRVLGLDLNPNYIGLSVLSFYESNKFRVLHKRVFDLSNLNKSSGKSSEDKKSIYSTNKRTHELIQICHVISNLMNVWKCSKLVIEDLSIKSSDKKHGKAFNRLCNNVWKRDIVVNKLKMLSVIHGFELVEINPAYSSFIGNMLYGNENTPDMIASSIEIARRGYKKFEKGWFYPAFHVDMMDERWKQTLNGVKNWKSAFEKIKESGLRYRFQLLDNIQNAVFRKDYSKCHWKVYTFL